MSPVQEKILRVLGELLKAYPHALRPVSCQHLEWGLRNP
jgi:hypothetical protein